VKEKIYFRETGIWGQKAVYEGVVGAEGLYTNFADFQEMRGKDE
jgi:hypothetical protein